MDELVMFGLRCGYCRRRFIVCRPDYRGQGYCNVTCGDLEQAAKHRLTNAKHQRSEQGRQDHVDHQRALVARKQAEVQAMTDVGRQEVAPRAECSTPDGSPMLMTSTPEADGKVDADDLHGRDDPVGDADPRAAEPWTRRASRSEERRVGKECRSRWS